MLASDIEARSGARLTSSRQAFYEARSAGSRDVSVTPRHVRQEGDEIGAHEVAGPIRLVGDALDVRTQASDQSHGFGLGVFPSAVCRADFARLGPWPGGASTGWSDTPCASWRANSAASSWPCDAAMSLISSSIRSSCPSARTAFPVPPGSVFVPVNVGAGPVDRLGWHAHGGERLVDAIGLDGDGPPPVTVVAPDAATGVQEYCQDRGQHTVAARWGPGTQHGFV